MEILNQIPIGSSLKVKKTGDIVKLEEIRYYPTRYKTLDKLGKTQFFKTHEVEII